MSDTQVNGNALNVWVRPGLNAGVYRVHVDNNPLFDGEAAGKIDPEEIEYSLEFNGQRDIAFNGAAGSGVGGHHWHLPGGGVDKLQHTNGYTTVLQFITSDGVTSARLVSTVRGFETVHDFNVTADFPVV